MTGFLETARPVSGLTGLGFGLGLGLGFGLGDGFGVGLGDDDDVLVVLLLDVVGVGVGDGLLDVVDTELVVGAGVDVLGADSGLLVQAEARASTATMVTACRKRMQYSLVEGAAEWVVEDTRRRSHGRAPGGGASTGPAAVRRSGTARHPAGVSSVN
jgi:hypothetical protein